MAVRRAPLLAATCLLPLVWGVPALAQGAPSAQGFEAQSAQAISLPELVRAGQAFGRDCGCADGDLKKACEKEKESAAALLKKGQKVKVSLARRHIEVGPYERGTRKLLLTIPGGLLEEAELPTCATDEACGELVERRGRPLVTGRLEISTAPKAWQGTVEADAKRAELIDDASPQLDGELLFTLGELQTKSAPATGNQEWKAEQTREVQRELSELRTARKNDQVQPPEPLEKLIADAEAQLSCLQKAEPKVQTLSLQLERIGVRLFAHDERLSGWLLSDPPSQKPPESCAGGRPCRSAAKGP